jgi:hypothetical protein
MVEGVVIMDHEQAIQTEASMRYALGELTPAERDSFEEHFVDCSFCMRDVEQSAAFAANARQVFRERVSAGTKAARFAWWQWRPSPALALSAAFNLVLVAGLGYSLLRPRLSAPDWTPAGSAELQSAEIVPLHGITRGGEGSVPVARISRGPAILTLDLPQSYEHYYYSIERVGVATILSGEVKVPAGKDSLNLPIPADRLSPGEYRVTVIGATGAARESLAVGLLQVDTR